MAVAAFESRAALRSGRGVDSQLQAVLVEIVGEPLHVRKLFIRMKGAVRVARALPAVVDVHIHVAGIAHAGLDQGVGDVADGAIVDRGLEMVPGAESHGWRAGETVRGKRFHRRDRELLRREALEHLELLRGRSPQYRGRTGTARRREAQPIGRERAVEGGFHAARHLDDQPYVVAMLLHRDRNPDERRNDEPPDKPAVRLANREHAHVLRLAPEDLCIDLLRDPRSRDFLRRRRVDDCDGRRDRDEHPASSAAHEDL